jgi:hypothetical protein
MESVTLNREQRLYVIADGGGFSCLGFDNARGHADQIAQRLRQPDLAFTAEDTTRWPATASTRLPRAPGASRH